MSLDPSPLSPTPTPLLNPTDPAPGRGAALVGACVSVLLAIVVGFVSTHFATRLIYLPVGIKANAQQFQLTTPFQVQGFNYQWIKSWSLNSSMGYTNDTTNKNILQSEARDYHMNLVVITVIGDVGSDNTPLINFTSGIDSYPDAVYTNVVKAAQQYDLTPVFKLELRDTNATTDQLGAWSGFIGAQFSTNAESTWVDNYTEFTTHYARLAQQLHMPFFIVGTDLDHLTVDGADTKAKPKLPPDDTFTCSARRDCEWRHIAAAVRNTDYHLLSGAPQQGGGYAGKLIYAANGGISSDGANPDEWKNITWWDAMDYIGINAFFPLLDGTATSDVQVESAWHKDSSHGALASSNTINLFDAFSSLSSRFGEPILFTGAGYESTSGSNGNPGDTVTGQPDDNEQLNDMQGLLETFNGQPWWLGVIWSSDFAIWPRDSLAATFSNAPITSQFFRDTHEGNYEYNWPTNTEWAGDCLSASSGTCPGGGSPAKSAGAMLNKTYTIKPIPPPTD